MKTHKKYTTITVGVSQYLILSNIVIFLITFLHMQYFDNITKMGRKIKL